MLDEIKSSHRTQDLESRLRRLEDLIENAADAILVGTEQGIISYANCAAAELSGYQRSELVGSDVRVLFSEHNMEQEPLRFDLLQQGSTLATERLLKLKNGNFIPIEMKSRQLPDGTLHTFIRDITERKKIEMALRLSEEKFSRAFTLSPDSININRLSDGAYLAVNEGFTRIMGWTEEEVLGRNSADKELNIWFDLDDRQRLVNSLHETGEVVDFEALFCAKGGRQVNGLMSARVIEINGESCILSMTRDISERVNAQEKERKLEEQFLQAQKLESLGMLAGGIAHDFNNILMGIIGNTELALRRLRSESPAVGYLRNIQTATTRATDLAKQMLAYSGKGKFVIEHLNLNCLIEEMIHLLEVSISKKVELRLNPYKGLPAIEADATQIRQIVMNLIINASEAIDSKNGFIAVKTGCMECDRSYLDGFWSDSELAEGLYVYLEVSDNGCGMDRESIAKVFDPFFSTKFTGRGLGLSAVQGIVKGHNGAIRVYSEKGKGTTFKVFFPASDAVASSVPDLLVSDDWQGQGTVLLVDDEEAILTVGRSMLEELGFNVVTATDGKDAVKVFQAAPEIGLVLLDLTMPHMDGEQCFRELKKINPGIKVIISSGYNEAEVTKNFVAKGLAGFLQKPYRLAALKDVVRQTGVNPILTS